MVRPRDEGARRKVRAMSEPQLPIREAALREGARHELERAEGAANTLEANVDNTGFEASANRTTAGEKPWSFSAYVGKLWRGPWKFGGRATKKL